MTPSPDRFGPWAFPWSILFPLAVGASFFFGAWVASKVDVWVVDVVRWVFV